MFSITTSGVEKVLHSFGAAGDGSYPTSNLIDVGGLFYGTTDQGGAYSCYVSFGPGGCGTVFTITTSGTENVLYRFGKGTDGVNPSAGLINVKGTLYGTTSAGGGYDCSPFTCGTVFSITTTGTEKVLHSFGKAGDGVQPVAGLIDVAGALYGTTYSGGAYGWGTVFSITTAGKEKVLHSFDFTDGASPEAPLIAIGSTLYGTTVSGGTYSYCAGSFRAPCGTVFSITTSGTEKVLHTFGYKGDCCPVAGLVNVKGTLYGMTESGGNVCGIHNYSCGTAFSITTAGQFNVWNIFSEKRGCHPWASLIYNGGRLIGTTSECAHQGGTVFSLTP